MPGIGERRLLQRTGQSLPVLGLGGAALGNLHGAITDEAAAAVFDAAWQAGIGYFDTAPLYGRGIGELRTGHALRPRQSSRPVVSTKVGWCLEPLRPDPGAPAGALPFAITSDYSREGTLRSIEASLLRMGLARLDIALVHDVDPWNHGAHWRQRLREAIEGALPALADLRRQGLVGAVGLAVNSVEACSEALAAADVDVLMLAGRYTLLDRSADDGLFAECLRRSIGVIVGAPFNSGILAGGSASPRFNYRQASPAIAGHVATLERECRARGVSLAAAALQFPLRHPAVKAVVTGPRSAEQLAGLVAAFAEPIPADLWARLSAPSPPPPPQTRE